MQHCYRQRSIERISPISIVKMGNIVRIWSYRFAILSISQFYISFSQTMECLPVDIYSCVKIHEHYQLVSCFADVEGS